MALIFIKPKTMKTKLLYLVFLFFFPISLYSQSDTLKLKAEYNIPFKYSTSGMNLAYDGTDLWITEHLSGNIYRIDTNGICLDTISSIRTTCIESTGSDLWIINEDWLHKLNKNNGQSVDSIKIEIPQVFQGAYQCRDICYSDSSFFSIWAYCWCGIYRILKTDLKTKKTTDLGDIPLYDNLVNINDTIWAGGGSGLYPIYSNSSNINSGRKLYPGGFEITGIAFVINDIWVIENEFKRLKVFPYPFSILTASEKLISEDKIIIYPNPASDYVIIHTSDNINEDNLIEVFDISGKKIISGRQKSSIHKLDLKEAEPGLYMIRVSNKNHSVAKSIFKN